jgi:SAM-dependent methyltransferase
MAAKDVHDFETWSATYEESWLQHLYFDRIHNHVLDLIDIDPPPSGVLDAGCGTGRLLRKIRQRWPDTKLYGIDPAEGMINKAREMMPDATFILGSAESIMLPDSSVDFVISTTSFHHWEDQNRAIQEIYRILRKGGYFVLAEVTLSGFLLKISHHGHICNPGEIRKMFEDSGFIVQGQRRMLLRHALVTIGMRKD